MLCSRRWALAAVAAGLAGVAVGCGDMGALAYFLSPEQALPARLKHLPSEDPKKEPPRVVILTYSGVDMRPEFIHADRQLSEMLAQNLRQLAEVYKQRITIIPPRKVEEFKNSNPNWRGMDTAEIGRRYFNADYVIYLELRSLSLYEPGNSTLYRGRANLLVSLVDVNNPDESGLREDYECIYPSTQGPIPVDIDVQPMRFCHDFLGHIARQLSWRFSNYPRSENRIMERPY